MAYNKRTPTEYELKVFKYLDDAKEMNGRCSDATGLIVKMFCEDETRAKQLNKLWLLNSGKDYDLITLPR